MKRAGRKPGSMVRFKCLICSAVELVRGGGGGFRCSACRARGAHLPRVHRDWLGKEAAQRQVSAAIRDGLLPRARGLKCADCGHDAMEYEHRDYNQPLAVEPICRGCNLRRGPAVPLAGSVDKLLARGLIPYRSIRATRMLFARMGRPDVAEMVRAKPTLDDWRRLWPLLGTEGTPEAPAEAKA